MSNPEATPNMSSEEFDLRNDLQVIINNHITVGDFETIFNSESFQPESIIFAGKLPRVRGYSPGVIVTTSSDILGSGSTTIKIDELEYDFKPDKVVYNNKPFYKLGLTALGDLHENLLLTHWDFSITDLFAYRLGIKK